jgi:hypothetical protein
MKTKTKTHQDVWLGVVIVVACGFFLTQTTGKPGNAMLLPIILLTAMALIGIIISIGGVWKTKAASPANPVDNSIQWVKLKAPFDAFLYIAGYVFLFWFIGYFAATFVFITAMMTHFKMRNPLQVGLVSLGFIILVYALFVKQLNVPVLNFGYVGHFLNS